MAASAITGRAIEPLSAYELLACCTRAIGSPEYYTALREQAARFTTWEQLPALAEQHGMAPLLYHHVRKAEINIPPDVEITLKGMIVRNRRYTQAFVAATAEIVQAFAAAKVPVVVLKGIALATLIYPDPALRPTTDLDLLIEPEHLDQSREILRGLGYSVPSDIRAQSTRETNGIVIPVDLQVTAPAKPFSAFWQPMTDPFVGFSGQRMPFDCNGVTGYTLGRDEMLVFLSRHMAKHLLKGSSQTPLRLIWIADLVSYAEHFRDSLDWHTIQRIEPRLPGRLSACADFSSLTDPLRRMPRGTDTYYQGWLHRKLSDVPRIGWRTFATHTFFPPEWWLRIYYGAPYPRPSLASLWAIHMRHVMWFAIQRVLAKLGVNSST
jgi:hypothetical protein